MNGKEQAHVSTLTLDAYWASGRSGDAALEAHLAGCPRCRAYLAELAALEAQGGPAVATADPDARPATARAAPAKAAPIHRRWRGAALVASGALALAASVVAVVRTHPGAPEGYVGVKGTPAVQVLVHGGGDTRIWDERSPVRPGDALALRVACEGLRHVTVAAPGPAGWMRLSDAPCPVDGAPLPFTLLVDGEPGDERLALVLSQVALDDGALRQAIQESRRSREVWAVQFVLPKTIEVQR